MALDDKMEAILRSEPYLKNEDRIEKLEKALEFYADLNNHNEKKYCIYRNNKQISKVMDDKGKIARQALHY